MILTNNKDLVHDLCLQYSNIPNYAALSYKSNKKTDSNDQLKADEYSIDIDLFIAEKKDYD